MVLSDEEARNLIETLIVKYVPSGMDKINALEKIHAIGKALFQIPKQEKKCPDCGLDMFCRKCDYISVRYDVDVTVMANNIEIY